MNPLPAHSARALSSCLPGRGRSCVASWHAATTLVMMLLVSVTSCRNDAPPPPGRTRGPVAFPVEVEAVAASPVDYVTQVVGSVEAFEIVQVTSRVAGVVERVRFQEGDPVNVNEILVEIEPRRFRLALQAERAALEKARAAQADAEAGLDRRQAAVDKTPGLIPGEEVATWKTRVATAVAEVAAAEAALASADLNLRDAYVRAPVKGTIETRSVQTGQYVQPGAVLATLVRRDPLLLRFAVPSDAARVLRRGDIVHFTTTDAQSEHRARITSIALAADPATRQVPIVAQVEANDATELRPGAFARVTARLNRPSARSGRDALAPEGEGARGGRPAIPESAIRPSEKGFIAFVVNNGKAEERRLSLGLRTADGRVEVREGLALGESLVVRGAEALRDGATVKVTTSTPSAPQGS